MTCVKASPFSRLCGTFLCNVSARRLCLTVFLLSACDGVSRPDDTLGLQSAARWEWHGRLVVEADSAFTLVRMRIDTTHGGGDVGLARYDFNPARPTSPPPCVVDRKSTRLNSSHVKISYAVFCLKKKKKTNSYY